MRVYRPSSWFARLSLRCYPWTLFCFHYRLGWLFPFTLFLNSPTPWNSKIYMFWNFLSVTIASLRLLASFQALLCRRWVVWVELISFPQISWILRGEAQTKMPESIVICHDGWDRTFQKNKGLLGGKLSSALLLWDTPLPRDPICPGLSPTGLEQLKSIRTVDLSKTLGFSVVSSLLFLPPIRRLMVEGPRQRWESFLSHQPVLIENGME